MVDITKQDMSSIWASAGDVQAPDPVKIATGWIVEAVPRQWWNWFENRQDTNIAYILQKGFPEWDTTTEYIANKSYVQRNGIVYKATATNTNTDPSTLVSWIRVFADYSVSAGALGALTPSANQLPYFTGTDTAATTPLSAFARTLLDDVDATVARNTLSAQASNVNLTSLSGVSALTNGLPYFTSGTAMGITTLTAFGRSLLDDTDAASARATLGVASAVDSSAALAAGLATKQPLSSTLTVLSQLTPAANKLPYFNASSTSTTTDFTAFARTLLDDVDADAARATLALGTAATRTVTTSTTDVTPGRLLKFGDFGVGASVTLATPDLNTIKDTGTYYCTNTINGVPGGANGWLEVMSLDANYVAQKYTTVSATQFARVSNNGIWGTWLQISAGVQPIILGGTGATTALGARDNIGASDASNLSAGTIPLARIPATLTGKNAATATALQTARTIQGVSFDGTANITLPVISRDTPTGAASMPVGGTSSRPATPSDGMLRYNSQTLEFEGYQNGGWAGIGGGSPLFTVLWWPSRASIPTGYLPADGQLLSRTTYQAAFAGVNGGTLPVVTDANWLSDITNRASYTLGNGSTTFRIPDLNGASSGSAGALFLRGDGLSSGGIAGKIQLDALQNITAALTIAATNSTLTDGSPSGAITAATLSDGVGRNGSSVVSNYRYTFSAANVARTSTETRPLNATGVYVIKITGGASDVSQDDAIIAVAALETRVAVLEAAQTVQNVIGSRVLGTTYTNSTSKTIDVYISVATTNTASKTFANLNLNGIRVAVIDTNDLSSPTTAVPTVASGFMRVPPGFTYSVTNGTGVNTLYEWRELR